ncbi:FAD/FMN-containing dehydrogenase [Friedmanniella luteola]|uniref:FAD/FMN-containing dehydrogenase n=1 Tax=Friedmanniella luteola TaxID=546871 RepID=A0A1H1Y564_9ACTN|nr:FAD-binding and (Fe-S)-binding domain-containing protein [Friedmanniella luteola]SDT16573.1 FAD/FMN-containing dehydrogenase [Friedmanniella luteola]
MPNAVSLPNPVAELPEVGDLRAELRRRRVPHTLDSTKLTRALYSSDASLYRVVPQAVAHPRTVEEAVAVLDAARAVGMPVTTRGAGTSCAGNAVGPGLVLDTARHLTAITALDPGARTATVEPGVVQSSLQVAAAPHGLRFGPDPSTHNRCTIGGMIGNNACGPRALGYGRTADNVVALDVLTGSGERLRLDGTESVDAFASLTALKKVVGANLGTIRTEFGRFGRQVSGYSLEHLLPERRFDVARFFAGTEGTLGVILGATVRLVEDSPHKLMVALGYASMADAGDAATAILPHRPTAAEGLDRRIVEVVRRTHGEAAVPPLPRGDGWMFVEVVGDDAAEVRARAERVLADGQALDGFVVDDPRQALALWKIREDGAGLAGVSLASPAYPGWEDAAVPPEHLGSYLRDFDALLASHGLDGLPYGHFGDGCVHVRIDFPLTTAGGDAVHRAFLREAAALVARYGGSMSGEHGDGRARSSLLPAMYSADAIRLFGEVKAAFDPDDLLNPGVLVDPRPFDADLRAVALVGKVDHFAQEVHNCSGVGKCLANTTPGLGVMCPSYQATREEKDSTRGRARVLQEMINGEVITMGWKSPAVHQALDLCLSCKGCARDCPTGIDMASYKSQVIDHTYRGKIRPRSHYTLGWLPRWGRMITRNRALSTLINTTMATPGLRRVVRWSAGVDQRRALPRFATRAARDRVDVPASGGRRVVLWVDSFSDCFTGEGVEAAVALLTQAGYAPEFLERNACCGLTWISTGQRDGARRQLREALDVLHPHVAAGTPVVGLEPSCLAVWRSDAAELLPDDPRVGDLAAGVLTMAELLTRTEGWRPPDLSGVELVAQPHCHHASVIGWKADADLLAASGATVTTVGGCCGLAGNFGAEKGHYDVSVKVAQHDLLPAVESRPDAVVLADGFSCRTQLAELAGRRAVTLAELLTRPHPS